MWRFILIGISIVGITLFGFSLADVSGGNDVGASTVIDAPEINLDGFTRAIEPYDWEFPADFGAHPDFQTEWWYYTGNVETDEGRRFGYQFTIFRRAIQPVNADTASEWRTNQIYMAHFTVSDIGEQNFYHEQRYSRSSADLAGATVDPVYRVWLDDWEIIAQNDDASVVQIIAETDEFGIDMMLTQTKPPALQGDNGLSPKSEVIGNASYYYTLSRLETIGEIRINDEQFAVEGLTWKDHEFSTSALGTDAQGWDWFGLIFDDNSELMVGQIRLVDGGKEPAFGGLYIYPDGSTQYIDSEDITMTVNDTWLSPHTDATYPAAWTISIQVDDDLSFTFDVDPLQPDQELHGSNVDYWEGAVEVSGDKTGFGYAELTGYVDTMQGQF